MLNAPILKTSSDGFQVMKLSNSIIVFLVFYLVFLGDLDGLDYLDFLVYLDIKSEMHDIAVLHHIVLTLDAHLTGLANGGL